MTSNHLNSGHYFYTRTFRSPKRRIQGIIPDIFPCYAVYHFDFRAVLLTTHMSSGHYSCTWARGVSKSTPLQHPRYITRLISLKNLHWFRLVPQYWRLEGSVVLHYLASLYRSYGKLQCRLTGYKQEKQGAELTQSLAKPIYMLN